MLKNGEINHFLAHEVCDDEHPLYERLCGNVFELLGVTPGKLNESMLSFYVDHLPAGISTYQAVHYAQNHVRDDRVFANKERERFRYLMRCTTRRMATLECLGQKIC